MRLEQGSIRIKAFLKTVAVCCMVLFEFCAAAQPADTLRSFMRWSGKPYVYQTQLNHKEDGSWKKVKRGTLYAFSYNVVIGAGLTLASEQVTQWSKKDKFNIQAIKEQYKTSFSTAPVIDKDIQIINYLGHPYQGAFYYNCLRSQGAKGWQSALFCAGHALVWEYAWEGGIEQPSIQDLLITPIGGILLGELTNVMTIKMSRNGFRWHEVAIVCLLNPAYAINNGFKASVD